MQQVFSGNPLSLPSWQALQDKFSTMAGFNMADTFVSQPERFDEMSICHQGMLLDFSKNLIDSRTLELLIKLADEAGVPAALAAQYRGAILNSTEKRAALHSALRRRADEPLQLDGEDLIAAVQQVHTQMEQLIERVHGGQWTGFDGQTITDVVNIGIGGSFLGPQLAVEALQLFATGHVRCHFLANIDSSEFHQISRQLNPARTLFIVSSKSFGTLETLKNALAARHWMLESGCSTTALAQHFVAVSSNVAKAVEFGIAEENILPMWDWVGGRYSLWSAIGLPVAMAVGMQHFLALLEGARLMDHHAQEAPLGKNMPVILALLGIWYANFYGAQSHGVLPYDNYLRSLPDYLQQLDMESNGKQVRHDGQPLEYSSGPVIWGNIGTNGQHAYHQLLLQGTQMIPVDFIVAARSLNPVGDHHQWLFANCLSQSEALMNGKSLQQAEAELRQKGFTEEQVQALAAHKVIPGNRPSNTLVLPQLDPQRLGALIALYEHKVFVQSVIWGINAFDQWGVELGKELGDRIYPLLGHSCGDSANASTAGLAAFFRQANA